MLDFSPIISYMYRYRFNNCTYMCTYMYNYMCDFIWKLENNLLY